MRPRIRPFTHKFTMATAANDELEDAVRAVARALDGAKRQRDHELEEVEQQLRQKRHEVEALSALAAMHGQFSGDCVCCAEPLVEKTICQMGCGHALHMGCAMDMTRGLHTAVMDAERDGGGVDFLPFTRCPSCRATLLEFNLLRQLPWGMVEHIQEFVVFAKKALLTSQASAEYCVPVRELCISAGLVRSKRLSPNTSLETMLAVIARIIERGNGKFVVCNQRDCSNAKHYVVFEDGCGNADEAAAAFTCHACVTRQTEEAAAAAAAANAPAVVHLWHHTPATVEMHPLRCDECETPVMRDPGGRGLCSHETCPACEHQFCYVCGGEYNRETRWYTLHYDLEAVQSMPYCAAPAASLAPNRAGHRRRFGRCLCREREWNERHAREARGVPSIRGTPLESFAMGSEMAGFGYDKLSRPFAPVE